MQAKVMQRGRAVESRGDALPVAARIVRRWPSLTTRIRRTSSGVIVEYARRNEVEATQ